MKRSVPINSASLTFKAFASSLKTSMRLFMSKKKKRSSAYLCTNLDRLWKSVVYTGFTIKN